jgi:hypothetical protein
MLGDIDLIFGIWVYSDELQIKFTFRSGPIIFDRIMALGLWNLAKYLVVTTYTHIPNIKSISQNIAKKSGDNFLNFWITDMGNYFWPNYGPWTLKFGQIFSCHHFISLWFEILTWFFCIIVYNHKLQISFEIRWPKIIGP